MNKELLKTLVADVLSSRKKKLKKTSDRRGRERGRWKEYAMQMKYNRANYAVLYTSKLNV